VESKYKYLSILIAYKNINKDIKEILTKYSVYHIDEKDDLDFLEELMVAGQKVGLNERLQVYLEKFNYSILEKLEKGYMLDIIEIHKSYDISRRRLLEELDMQFGENILVVDEIVI